MRRLIIFTVGFAAVVWLGAREISAHLPLVALPPRGAVPVVRYNRAFALKEIGKERLVRPSAVCVGTSGEVFVADAATCRIYRVTVSGSLMEAFGSLGQGPGEFDSPSALALDRRGQLYVADTNNNRIQVFNARAHPPQLLRTIREHVDHPSTLAFDRDGGLIVASQTSTSGGIQRFNALGSFVEEYGTSHYQGDVAATPQGYIYTLESSGCQNHVRLYDRYWRQMGEFAGHTTAFGDHHLLYYPRGICATASRIYVNRFGDGMVNVYDSRGTYVQTIGRDLLYVNHIKELIGPIAIDADSSGSIYVCVQGNSTLQKFDPTGRHL